MPIYSRQCEKCACVSHFYSSISERNKETACQRCGAPTNRLLDAPNIAPDYEDYSCPVTGKAISGKRAHEENLKRLGCRLLEPGEVSQVSANKKQADRTFSDLIGEQAARAASTLDETKTALLAHALTTTRTEYDRSTVAGDNK